jgi:hypothetical protein
VRFTVADPGARAPVRPEANHGASTARDPPPMSKKDWRRQMLLEKHERNMERTREQVKRSMDMATNRRELRFQKNLKELRDDDEFVRGLFDHVASHEATQRQKQRKLYQDWEREVFNKIQDQVASQVDALDIFELEARKMKLYKEFISAENRMQEGTKRDEVDTGEYNPFSWQEHAVKYKTRNLDDPVSRDLQRMYQDRVGPGNVGGEVPKSKSKVMLDPTFYTKDKLSSTPYGREAQLVQGEGKSAEEMAMRAKNYRDSVGLAMNDYDPLKGQPQRMAARLEFKNQVGTAGLRRVLPYAQTRPPPSSESEFR